MNSNDYITLLFASLTYRRKQVLFILLLFEMFFNQIFFCPIPLTTNPRVPGKALIWSYDQAAEAGGLWSYDVVIQG